MKRFIVKTNFGHTYEWLPALIAKDYADTAVQFQDNLKTWDELYSEIVNDEEWLDQWFCDYIRDDVRLAMGYAKLLEINSIEEQAFIRWAFGQFGCVE